MRKRGAIALTAAALIALAVFIVQVVLPRSHMLFPPRASNGVDYVLYVNVPEPCRAGGCPALYLLDGERWLPAFVRTADMLAERQQITPVVIVGIGYRDIFGTEQRRRFDFTPGAAGENTGGADAYLSALERDLIPYAEAHLPIRRDYRALAGHSYGGLFALYALSRSPDLFDDYAAFSPALWFDNGRIFETEFAPTTREKIVFLSAETARGEARSDVASNTLRIADLLSERANIQVSRTTVVGEDHESMVEPSARAALRALFGTEQR